MNYDKKLVVKWFAEHGLLAEPEYRFHSVRKWRFDFALCPAGCYISDIPLYKVALEVEGGVWVSGRHTRGSGFAKDMAKYNEAAAMGWRILRVEPKNLCMQETVDLIKRALNVTI